MYSDEGLPGKALEEFIEGKVALGFGFDSWHIGAIATCPDADGLFRDLSKRADRRLLRICRAKDSVWASFAGDRKVEPTKLQLLAAEHMRTQGCVAFGEAHHGRPGWELSHRQAAAALAVGLRRDDRIVRYGDVSLEASLLHDPVRAASLRQRYLAPLEAEVDGGEKSRRTLSAYFSRNRSIKSAAIALGVVRQTVSYRLERIEARLGSELDACAHDLKAALALNRLDRGESAPGP